jgi:hypothetical protein
MKKFQELKSKFRLISYRQCRCVRYDSQCRMKHAYMLFLITFSQDEDNIFFASHLCVEVYHLLDVTSCGLLEVHLSFARTYCLHLQVGIVSQASDQQGTSSKQNELFPISV